MSASRRSGNPARRVLTASSRQFVRRRKRASADSSRPATQVVRGGTYALVIYLSEPTSIRIGALGRFRFPRGYYLYIGSAMNGLDARIQRHLRQNKKLHWHIDYFLEHARIVEVWSLQGNQRMECAWANRALALDNAQVVAKHFGASDCACRAHLIYLQSKSALSNRNGHATG